MVGLGGEFKWTGRPRCRAHREDRSIGPKAEPDVSEPARVATGLRPLLPGGLIEWGPQNGDREGTLALKEPCVPCGHTGRPLGELAWSSLRCGTAAQMAGRGAVTTMGLCSPEVARAVSLEGEMGSQYVTK